DEYTERKQHKENRQKKRKKDESLSQLREEEDEHEELIDKASAIRQATRESIQSQHEWHRREEFKRNTGGWNNIYEEGRSSHGSTREYHRERTSKSIPSESEFTLRGAIPELVRSKSSKQPKYGVGTTSGHFRDRSEFDGNMFPEPRRDRSEPRAPSKGKGKKHTSIGSSSSRRSSSSNLGCSDSSTSTQGFYPPKQLSYFQPSHGYPQPYGYYPPFTNYGVSY
ncbi:hypothetical protein Gotur_023522, partial [Gossypium turneri]